MLKNDKPMRQDKAKLIDKKFKSITEATAELRNELKYYGIENYKNLNPFMLWYSPRNGKFSAHVMGTKIEHQDIVSCLRLCEKEIERRHNEFTEMQIQSVYYLHETTPIDQWNRKKIIAVFRKMVKSNVKFQSKSSKTND